MSDGASLANYTIASFNLCSGFLFYFRDNPDSNLFPLNHF